MLLWAVPAAWPAQRRPMQRARARQPTRSPPCGALAPRQIWRPPRAARGAVPPSGPRRRTRRPSWPGGGATRISPALYCSAPSAGRPSATRAAPTEVGSEGLHVWRKGVARRQATPSFVAFSIRLHCCHVGGMSTGRVTFVTPASSARTDMFKLLLANARRTCVPVHACWCS